MSTQNLFDKYAVRNPKNVVIELWKRSVEGMTKEDLEWFQSSDDDLELGVLTDAINASGYALVCQKDNESVESNRIGNLLLCWSEYLCFLRAMDYISRDADKRLKGAFTG